MDNEEDYIELYRLLAKCKFNLVKDELELCNKGINTKELTMSKYYEEKNKTNRRICSRYTNYYKRR